jgi:hypothetical protein
MATLTIIKDDKFVSVDGEGLTLDAVVLAANVHAIQFDGTNGHIEYNDGTPNESITSISDYSTITDDHATLKAANATAASDAATETATEEAKYGWKRLQEYPSIEECVHAILDDELTALQVKRQAVKDKYPK